MPELPEVETLRRVLVPLVEGKVLTKIRFFPNLHSRSLVFETTQSGFETTTRPFMKR